MPHPIRPTRTTALSTLALGALVLGACSDGGGAADPVAIEGSFTDEDQSTDQSDGTEAELTDDGAASDDGDDAASDDADDTAGDEAGVAGDLVDMTEAIPGTWPVGDAGTVTFSIVDGALVLDDVTAAEGWTSQIDEQDADEIEVDFRQGDVEWQIEIELESDGTILSIEIDQDIENADAGSYDIGDAGTFAFEVQDGRLVLTDLNVADGWTVVEQDEEADDIEIELTNGPRTFDVDIELESNGTVDIEIDFEVTGPVDA